MFILNYNVEEIAPKVFKVNEFGMSTMFIIEGEEQTLCIDCGTGVGDYLSVVKSLTSKPIILACTHGHVDHIGGRGQFATMRISRLDERIIKNVTTPMRRGFILVNLLYKNLTVPMKKLHVEKTKREPMTMYLRQGEKIELGGKTLEIIATPGHTKGSLSYLDVEDRILFTGDVINPCNFIFFPESDSVEALKNTLNKIESMSDRFDKIWCSHSDEPMSKHEFENAKKNVDEILKRENTKFPMIKRNFVEDYKIVYRTDNVHAKEKKQNF